MKIFDWHHEKRWTHCTAVIVAAGSATRMRGVDKIMAELCGEPVIAHTIRSFQNAGCIDEIVVVAREDQLEAIRKISEDKGFHKVQAIVPAEAANGISAGRPQCCQQRDGSGGGAGWGQTA